MAEPHPRDFKSLHRWKWSFKKMFYNRSAVSVFGEIVICAMAIWAMNMGYHVFSVGLAAFALLRNLATVLYFFALFDVEQINLNVNGPQVWVSHRDVFATLINDQESRAVMFRDTDTIHAFLFEHDLLVICYSELTYSELTSIVIANDDSRWTRSLRTLESRRGTLDKHGDLTLEEPVAKYPVRNT